MFLCAINKSYLILSFFIVLRKTTSKFKFNIFFPLRVSASNKFVYQ